MEPEKLVSLGFSYNEAQLYLALLGHGESGAGKLSKISGINRRTTYDALERLIQKGFVTFSIQSNRRIFRAEKPKTIIKHIKNMEEKAQDMLPHLQQIHTMSAEQFSSMYKGRKGIRSLLQELLSHPSYVVFGSNEQFPDIMRHDFALFQKKKKELRVKSKVLMSVAMKGKPILSTAYTQYRFLPKKFSAPTSTFVYGDKVAIVVWSEIPVALVVESVSVARAYSDYFDLLWESSLK